MRRYEQAGSLDASRPRTAQFDEQAGSLDASRPRTAQFAGQLNRWLPLIAVAGLLVVAWFLATVSSPGITELPLDLETGSPTPIGEGNESSSPVPTPGAPGSGGGTVIPDWVLTVGAVLCTVLAVGVMGVLAAMMLRAWTAKERPLLPNTGTPTPMDSTSEVLAALDAGLDELSDTDADPRRAVIACWVRLEHAAANAGTVRQIGDSPADLVNRLLGAHRVSRAVLDRFAAVYREARYATHTIDEQMRQTALTALRQLRGELAAGTGVHGGTGHA
jgi:hypothetical protein